MASKSQRKKYRIYVDPLAYIVSVIPWYLLAKVVLKLDIQYKINLEFYGILLFLMFYITQVAWNIKISKMPNKKEEEKLIENFAIGFGKSYGFLISVKALILLLVFIIALIATLL